MEYAAAGRFRARQAGWRRVGSSGCGRTCAVVAAEYARSQQAFQRCDCDHCFDEVFLDRRNWETNVELSKTIQTADGTVVQSDGERIIAEELAALGITFRYDNRFRIMNRSAGVACRSSRCGGAGSPQIGSQLVPCCGYGGRPGRTH